VFLAESQIHVDKLIVFVFFEFGDQGVGGELVEFLGHHFGAFGVIQRKRMLNKVLLLESVAHQQVRLGINKSFLK
jgi:hypothetical protein